jgi:hypothetical protein
MSAPLRATSASPIGQNQQSNPRRPRMAAMPLKRPPDARASDCWCRTKPATPGPSQRAAASAEIAESGAV